MQDEPNVLCAGAVKGLVLALEARFESETGTRLNATFGAVGAMREALAAGAPCDVLIVSDAMIAALTTSGELRPGSRAQVGRVQTAIAARSGSWRPAIDSADALKASLLAASELYFPDATLSTAGAHVVSMLDRLGVRAALASRLRMFANGATAMRELAAANSERAIGCTQATEIRATPGIALVGALPPPFALATVYSAAIAASARNAALAGRFIAMLGGPASRDLRVGGGFDADFAAASEL
jgi:molybdate transport system substrate-binding protein